MDITASPFNTHRMQPSILLLRHHHRSLPIPAISTSHPLAHHPLLPARTTRHRCHATPIELASLLAFAPPPACFDAACQQQKDIIFTLAITIPILTFIGAMTFILRLPDPDDSRIFDNPDTGILFESPDGIEPERDARGELAYKAVSYTPWPVPVGEEGERIRIPVGSVDALELRSFVFQPIIKNRPSKLISVRIPRPAGIIFEEEKKTKRVVIAELVAGGNAEQLAKKAGLDPSTSASAPAVGDILRAVTATNLVYKTGALVLGAQKPVRSIVVYGADGQRWPDVASALKRGLVADGDVTLVLERIVYDTD